MKKILMFKWRTILLCITVFLLASCAKATPEMLNANPASDAAMDRLPNDILSYINEYRLGKGLVPLGMETKISREAKIHSADMAAQRVSFGHEGFNDRAKRLTQTFTLVTAIAENVAEGQLSAKEVVEGWLNSPPHKKNIEGDFTLTGIGVAKDKSGQIYFTQIFLKK